VKPRPTELPTLETECLLLRPMRDEDAPALFTIYGDPEVMRYAGDEPFPDEATVAVMLWSVARLLAAGESFLDRYRRSAAAGHRCRQYSQRPAVTQWHNEDQ
jgi:RimJ/RimL family protein N-acetyltransferase